MSLEPDLLADRRRLRRRLTLWRALAILAVFGAIAFVAGSQGQDALPGSAHVLRLPVSGMITEDRRMLQALDRAATDASVRAVLVAHLHGNAPQVSVETGRKIVPTEHMPSFADLEQVLQNLDIK